MSTGSAGTPPGRRSSATARHWWTTPTASVRVRALGVDEHSYLSATPEHSTIYATSLVDLDRRIVIDLFEGKSAAKLRRWCATRSERWRKGVQVVALDLTDTYRGRAEPPSLPRHPGG